VTGTRLPSGRSRRVVPSGERDQDPLATFVSSVGEAYAKWRDGLARARASLTTACIHAFRIQTKRLRYRVELSRDLGSGTAQEALDSLKAIQDELGRWHDSAELMMLAADALADPEFLAQHPRTAAAVLRKIDRTSALQIERVRRLLECTHEGLDFRPFKRGYAHTAAVNQSDRQKVWEERRMEASTTRGRQRRLKTLWPGGFQRNAERLVEIHTDRSGVFILTGAIIQRASN
jgi:CHAD domain